MKKIIGMLVLCVCVSISNAALMFQAPFMVNNFDTFTVNVVSDVDVQTLSIGAITITGASSWGNNQTHFNYFNVNGTLRDGTSNDIAISSISGTNNIATYLPAGTVLFSFEVTSCWDLMIVIDDYVGASPFDGPPSMSTKVNAVATTLDPIIVYAIPEPTTMALLGLGGLFIRRRNL